MEYMKEGVSLRDKHFGHVDARQIVEIDVLKGKRIHQTSDVVFDDDGYMLLHFDDNTFVFFSYSRDYGIEIEPIGIEPYTLHLLGLVSKEEYETYKSDVKSRSLSDKEWEKERRRKQYETLKAEFGEE